MTLGPRAAENSPGQKSVKVIATQVMIMAVEETLEGETAVVEIVAAVAKKMEK